VVTMLTVVAAMENCVNIRPSRLMPCSQHKQEAATGVWQCVRLHTCEYACTCVPVGATAQPYMHNLSAAQHFDEISSTDGCIYVAASWPHLECVGQLSLLVRGLLYPAE
jgi:hypothetical protein